MLRVPCGDWCPSLCSPFVLSHSLAGFEKTAPVPVSRTRPAHLGLVRLMLPTSGNFVEGEQPQSHLPGGRQFKKGNEVGGQGVSGKNRREFCPRVTRGVVGPVESRNSVRRETRSWTNDGKESPALPRRFLEETTQPGEARKQTV